MTAIRHRWAGTRSVDFLHSSCGRRLPSFLVAALFLPGLAQCGESDHSRDQGETRSQESGKQPAQAAQEPPVFAEDSFDGEFGLDWDIVHPLASHWSLSKRPGTLTITTAAGTFVRSRADYKNLFLIDWLTDCCAGPGSDFQATTCLVSFAPKALWNQAGLVLWNDEDNFLSLVYEWGEGPPELRQKNQRMFTACVENEGRPVFSWYHAPQDQEEVWLRVTKRMNRFELSTSKDGATFTPLNPMRARGVVDNVVSWGDGIVRRLGLVASNGSAPKAAPVDASFDFFKVTALPAQCESPPMIDKAVVDAGWPTNTR